jgi:hypothetical protein
MAGRIIYLEIDDEITSAAARIRASDASRLAVVLPYGSRVATSRINFRLLSRDALTHEKRLSIVAADPATRALAASAGLPVFSSVAEYETSLVGIEDEPRPDAGPGLAAAAVVAVGAAPVVPASAGESPTPVVDEPPAASGPAPAVEAPESDGTLGLVAPAAVAGVVAGPQAVARSGVPAESVAAPGEPRGRPWPEPASEPHPAGPPGSLA